MRPQYCPTVDTAADLARLLDGHRSGAGYMARCPAHNDHTPSLSISDGDSGVVVHCHAGCSQEAVLAALKAQYGIRLNSPKVVRGDKPKLEALGMIVAAYEYRDGDGTLLYENVRFEPKTFRPRRPDGEGGWTWDLKGVKRVPYRLPELLGKPHEGESRTDIYVCEGEKDANRVVSLGLNATSIAFPDETDLSVCKDRVVWILEDNDQAGLDKGAKLATALNGIAAKVHIVRFPELPKKGDVSDFLNQLPNGTDALEALLTRCEDAENTRPRSASRLVLHRASELTPKQIEWTWPQRFPRGQLSLLAGHGNSGKTTVLLDIAARITRGDQWPDRSDTAKCGSVIYFSAEDSTEHTLLPRFMAAGGDRGMLYFVRSIKREDNKGVRTFHLQEDLRELEKAVKALGNVEAVIFDPISSYFGRTDTHKNTEVRTVLEPVAEFADRCGVTILGNTHFAKHSKATAMMRILDSVAMSALSRACYVVVDDPDNADRRLFLPAKWNLTKRQDGLAFTITEKVVGGGVTGTCVVWEDAGVATTADEALEAVDAKTRPGTLVDDAVGFLRECLASGAKPVSEVDADAEGRGIAPRTLKRAQQRLGVKYAKQGLATGPWLMRLPDEA